MGEKKYDFITKRLQFPGTSYSLQIGFLGDTWLSRIIKAENIIAEKDYEDIEEKFPNQNEIVNWVLYSIPIPNLNPHRIMNTIQTLAKEALKYKEKFDIEKRGEKKEEPKITKEMLQKQQKNYGKKLNFLVSIKNKIENGATGNEILHEYDNYPRHFAGILRMYDTTLTKIGENKIINHILKERKASKTFARLDSMDSYLKIIKNEIEVTEKNIKELIEQQK
ncbi:MAG: hypothetical protein EU543_01835 [Promethearchaeota archaeon]|nr:MAG: hypothetical protein EU543_01835 [Candidatus Lokiarchaeota archaeon]